MGDGRPRRLRPPRALPYARGRGGTSRSMARTTETQIRVRYAETDLLGSVYYANFFTYFGVARHEHLRQIGAGLAELLNDEGITMGVLEATCRYHAPAYFDELLTVRTTVEEVRTRAVAFRYEVTRDGTPIATGRTVQIFLKDRAPVPIPARVRAVLET
jgi:acyl-CoA thioester hydrolase